MKGIVLELQQELLSKDCDILNALRKAHIIATKLKLIKFDFWIQQELNGYSKEKDAPEYRSVRGELKAFNPYRGWIPTIIKDYSLEQSICVRKLCEPISSLIDLYDKSDTNGIQITFSGEALDMLHNLFNTRIKMQYVLFVGANGVKEIIEHVKDCLLQWTLQLEEVGIMGDDLSFTSQEREKAQALPQTINNYYGATNVINATTSNSQIVAGDNDNISFDYSIGESVVTAIRDSIEREDISQENKDEALELLKEIDSKIEKKKKPNIIKAALIGLKEFLISVSAGVTVSLIDAKMKGLF